MTEQPLFCDSVSEALKEAVKACGGSKKVAAKLWPEKSQEAAHTRLLDCLNDSRPDKLSPEQVLLLLKWEREAGASVAMSFLCGEAGYKTPEPRQVEEQARELLGVIAAKQVELDSALKRLERLAVSNPSLLKVVA